MFIKCSFPVIALLLIGSLMSPRAEAGFDCKQSIAAALLVGCVAIGTYTGVDAYGQWDRYRREREDNHLVSSIVTLPLAALDEELGARLANIITDDISPQPDLRLEYSVIALSLVGVGASGFFLACNKKRPPGSKAPR